MVRSKASRSPATIRYFGASYATPASKRTPTTPGRSMRRASPTVSGPILFLGVVSCEILKQRFAAGTLGPISERIEWDFAEERG